MSRTHVAGAGFLLVCLLNCGGEPSPSQGSEATSRRWLEPVEVDSYTGGALAPALSVDARSGEAVVIWLQDGSEPGLFSNRLVSGRWVGAEPVERGDDVGFGARLACNGNGVCFALWRAGDREGSLRLHGSRRQPGAGWELPIAVDGERRRSYVERIHVAAFADGGALAVWEDGGVELLASRFDPRGGWLPVESLSRDRAGPALLVSDTVRAVALWQSGGAWIARAFEAATGWRAESRLAEAGLASPAMALTQSGALALIWRRVRAGASAPEFAYSTVLGNLYRPGSGWTPLETLASEERMNCQTALVSSGATGALAVWSCRLHPVEDRSGTWSSRLTDGWEPAQRMAFVPESAAFERLAGDRAGRALGLWVDGRLGPSQQLLVAAFGSAGWGGLQPLGTPGVVRPQYLGLQQSGAGLAAWTEGSFEAGAQQIRASALVGGAWQRPDAVSGSASIHPLLLEQTDSGDAVAVWQQAIGGTPSVWSSQYVAAR